LKTDRIIIGAGIYGLYAARLSASLGYSVLVLEYEDAPFTRATYINQSRLHMGYHYPRSFSTAIKTAQYFERFTQDFKDSINSEFDQVYATSENFSWTNKEQFIKFCKSAKIRCDNIDPDKYFNPDMCDGAYITTEYAFDAELIKAQLLRELLMYNNVQIKYNVRIKHITKQNNEYIVDIDTVDQTNDTNEQISTKFILNATYASINQIQNLAGFDTFQIKYELCELILCKVSDNLKNTGITVMDGPFFSLMPFGKTGYHTLAAVTFTPHKTSYTPLPTFDCQKNSNNYCTPERFGNCNTCPAKPKSAWPQMATLARKYMKPELEFEYVDSLYSIKPILRSSELDDSRPTLIRTFSETPTFISVLSGKINTVYDLDEILD